MKERYSVNKFGDLIVFIEADNFIITGIQQYPDGHLILI